MKNFTKLKLQFQKQNFKIAHTSIFKNLFLHIQFLHFIKLAMVIVNERKKEKNPYFFNKFCERTRNTDLKQNKKIDEV